MSTLEQDLTKESTKLDNNSRICFRKLEENEYWKLVDIFEEYGGRIPNPKLSRIEIAEIEETGEIVGIYCLQLLMHAEPMWIQEKFRNTLIAQKLIERIEPYTRKEPTFIMATTENIVSMCEKLGLRRIEAVVYVKDV